MTRLARTDRPRHRRHRRHSRRLDNFLAAMVTKWAAYGTPITVSVAGVDELDLAATPDAAGPYRLVGAPPPELRDLERFWLDAGASDVSDVYTSRADASAHRGAVEIAAWSLAPTWAATETALAISAVTNAADTLTRVAHGLAVGDGPFYVAASVTIPTGLAATTPYWIQAVPTVDTLTLAASLGGAVINLTTDGSGAITLVPLGVDVSLDSIHIANHGMQTGDGPVRVSTAGALPTGSAAATDYYVIRLSAHRFKLATSRVLALAGTAVNLTAIGTGTSTLVRALTVRKDFTADGIFEWLAQGVSRDRMAKGLVAAVDTIFTD